MSWDSDYQKWRSDTGLPEQEVKSKPELIRQPLIEELNEQPYERYLPNAFDESLSLVERVNKVIYQQNKNNQLSIEVVKKWNDFVHEINEGGLIDNKIAERLQEEYLIELINQEMMGDLKNEINNKQNTEFINILHPPFPMRGAKGDGTNETAIIQAIVDYATTNKKALLIPSGYTFLISQIIIDGKSDFTIVGYGTLKRVNNSKGYTLVNIKNCTNFNIPHLTTDGNVSNNKLNNEFLSEYLHSLSIISSKGIKIGVLKDKNPCGDAVYLNDADDVIIQTLESVGDVMCGRNALSIIKGNNIIVNNLVGWNIGIPTMPGGIDLEPNLITETITNVTINNAIIRSSGTGCVEVANHAQAIVNNIEINATITKVNSSINGVFVLHGVTNFKGRIRCRQEGTTNCLGVNLHTVSNVNLDIDVDGGTTGLLLDTDVSNVNIKGKIRNTQNSGVTLIGVTKTILDLEIKNPKTKSTSTIGAYYIPNGATVRDVIFHGDCSKETTGDNAFRIDGNLINCKAIDLDMSNFIPGNIVYGVNAHQLITKDCPNYNYAPTMPINNKYKKGTVVWNTDPLAGGMIGWIALSDGVNTLKPFGSIST